MGGAQPLAVTMNEGVCIAIEVDEARARRRLDIGYVDRLTGDPAEALRWARDAAAAGRGRSASRWSATPPRSSPPGPPAGERFDLVTDQTSAHDALGGYVPGRDRARRRARAARAPSPTSTSAGRAASMAAHVRAMLAFQRAGAVVFDYGNNLRAQAPGGGRRRTRSTTRASCRPSSGRSSARAAGRSAGSRCRATRPTSLRTDRAVLELFPDDAGLARWIAMAQERVPFQGLPARICWLGYGERARAGLAFNELVRTGEVSAPIVIGRDHLDAGSVASPNRETEAMADGSDAVADWPLLNALVNTAAGASWVSIHHGGGVGIGYSQHAGMVVVADGTPLAAEKLERVLTTDPAMGVLRHVDAGYDRAIEVARERGDPRPDAADA